MKFRPTIGSDLSGSLAGITASHNTSGVYFRVRAVPTNPNSVSQQAVRSAMSNAHVAWLALGQAVKDAWNAYAAGTPVLDRIGASIHLTGRAMYLRDYVLRTIGGATLPPVTVSTMGLSNLTTPVATVTAPATGSIAYTNTDQWAITTGGFLFIFASQGKGVGVNFFKGPYRWCGRVTGNTAVPPTSPAAIGLPFNVQAGQRVFFRCIASDSEGRLSLPAFLFDLSA